MKRQRENNPIILNRNKPKELSPRTGKCPIEVKKGILAATIRNWFHVKEILNMNDLPVIDIGSVIMSFYSTYSCGECSTNVLFHKEPFPALCVACYNYRNRNDGILCNSCDRYMMDECASCTYTECSVHGMFIVDTRRCYECTELICKNCVGKPFHHELCTEGSESEEIDFCYECYISYRDGT